MNNPYLQHEAEIVERSQDVKDFFTIKLRFTDPKIQKKYSFKPGQFNMLYLYGVGETAISIVSSPKERLFSHAIRFVGMVTRGLYNLKVGDRIGIRGPFGRGWPMEEAKEKDIIILTGGSGCAPLVCSINSILENPKKYGRIKIMHGIKYSDELLFPSCYASWSTDPKADVSIALSHEKEAQSPFIEGYITDHLADDVEVDPDNTIVMMCGPEIMINVAIPILLDKKIDEKNIYLSLERNMKCGVGHCGHCQFGRLFVCKDGPVFSYVEVKDLLGKEGF